MERTVESARGLLFEPDASFRPNSLTLYDDDGDADEEEMEAAGYGPLSTVEHRSIAGAPLNLASAAARVMRSVRTNSNGQGSSYAGNTQKHPMTAATGATGPTSAAKEPIFRGTAGTAGLAQSSGGQYLPSAGAPPPTHGRSGTSSGGSQASLGLSSQEGGLQAGLSPKDGSTWQQRARTGISSAPGSTSAPSSVQTGSSGSIGSSPMIGVQALAREHPR